MDHAWKKKPDAIVCIVMIAVFGESLNGKFEGVLNATYILKYMVHIDFETSLV